MRLDNELPTGHERTIVHLRRRIELYKAALIIAADLLESTESDRRHAAHAEHIRKILNG